MKDKGNFKEGSVFSHILSLAIPTFFAELVNVLYSIVDRMFIGHIPLYGSLALSGVGVTFPLISFISAFASLVSTGGAPLASIKRGERNEEKAQLIMVTSVTFLVVIGVILTILLFIFQRPLLLLMGADSSTLDYAYSYFSVYILGTVFVLISLGANSFINMQGYSVTAMATVIIGALLNTILDPIFIFGFKLGVRGASIATVISQAVSALWVLYFLIFKAPIKLNRFYLDIPTLINIVKLGISGFVFKLTNSLTQGVSNIQLRKYGGADSTLYIGAMSIINSIREMISLPIVSITNSTQPIISFNYGAGENKRVIKAIRIMVLIALSYGLISWALVLLFPSTIIGIFTPDETLVNITVHSAYIYFLAFFMMSFQSSGQTTFISLNKPKRAVFFSLLRKVFLVLPLSLLLPLTRLGVDGVFYAEFFSQLFGASCCFLTMYLTLYRPLKKESGRGVQNKG